MRGSMATARPHVHTVRLLEALGETLNARNALEVWAQSNHQVRRGYDPIAVDGGNTPCRGAW